MRLDSLSDFLLKTNMFLSHTYLAKYFPLDDWCEGEVGCPHTWRGAGFLLYLLVIKTTNCMVFQDLRIFIFRQVKQSLVFVVMLEYIAAPDA